MSAKENAAVSQLLALLESRYALRVLWALKDGHPQTFRLLQDSIGNITPNTLNTRIKELRAAGLLTHSGDGYTVTALGADLLKRINDLQAFAGKWVLSQARRVVKKPSATPITPLAQITPVKPALDHEPQIS
jgi:DNA-binding HxlR family transcriptional regulator